MAVVLKYATSQEGEPSRSMYSFFHRTISIEPKAAIEPDQHVVNAGKSNSLEIAAVSQPVPGLDGATDHAEATHRSHSRTQDRCGIRPVSNLSTTSVATSKPMMREQGQDNLENDPNETRRKRRKTTPVKTSKQEGDHDDAQNKKPAQGTLAWFSQPRDILHNTQLKQIPKSDCQVQTENHPNVTVAAPAIEISNATRKSPRKARQSAEEKRLEASITVPDKHLDYRHIENHSKDAQPQLSKGNSVSPKQENASQMPQPKPETETKGGRSAGLRRMKMKQGRFVQSLPIIVKYGTDAASRQVIGTKLNMILASKSDMDSVDKSTTALSKTHPFFLGKTKSKIIAILPSNDSESARESDHEAEEGIRKKELVPWKDIKFSSSKNTSYRTIDAIPPMWPPSNLQHIGFEKPTRLELSSENNISSDTKLKTRMIQLTDQENVLHAFGLGLQKGLLNAQSPLTPKKHILSGNDVAEKLARTAPDLEECEAIAKMRSQVKFGTTCFDRGETAGQNAWTSKYAPVGWRQVLQPTAGVLHDWLQNLVVHQIKTGTETTNSQNAVKTTRKKKKHKRLKDELDDFIVDSDDNDEQNDNTISPAALLITGPLGCGKTASVYAVAKELDFEVFEINPGLRRNAKDIFDKVGDMTRNHLVQRGGRSRSSSIAPPETDASKLTTTDNVQSNILNFSKSKKDIRKSVKHNEPVNKGKDQKQSLILLEEVDILFDEDKGFWSAVQSLIQNSKRPVIMTCNEMTNIPVDDLHLHTTLHFTAPDNLIATEYLTHIAAAEGHIIDRQAIATLYASKRNDLRASITELNLWCQMTVGSKYGGLDWMLQSVHGRPQANENNERLRIWSQGTYHSGLDMFPEISADEEYQIRQVQDDMGFPAIDWYMHMDDSAVFKTEPGCTNYDALDRLTRVTEARSILALLDEVSAPVLAATLAGQCPDRERERNRTDMTSLYFKQFATQSLQMCEIVESLAPIMEEKATFPPSQGRLAPSLDSGSAAIVTDVTPYVRSIVAFDRRLEQHREGVSGSQGNKIRNTRAARAAAEGGDKAKTRTERWFSKSLDFDMVMQTGNSWPEWYNGDQVARSDIDKDLSQSPLGLEV